MWLNYEQDSLEDSDTQLISFSSFRAAPIREHGFDRLTRQQSSPPTANDFSTSLLPIPIDSAIHQSPLGLGSSTSLTSGHERTHIDSFISRHASASAVWTAMASASTACRSDFPRPRILLSSRAQDFCLASGLRLAIIVTASYHY